ncbi:hypothetical protein TcCL_ESM02848 [Trypanosoma cruzi]|nr:hypothetical protein TcCL_ESM02848 [Trypanosoma cruzi]
MSLLACSGGQVQQTDGNDIARGGFGPLFALQRDFAGGVHAGGVPLFRHEPLQGLFFSLCRAARGGGMGGCCAFDGCEAVAVSLFPQVCLWIRYRTSFFFSLSVLLCKEKG